MRQILIFSLRLALGFVFIYAAVGKILDPAAFAVDIDNYRLLPYFWVTVMAATLPWLELLCGLAIIVGRRLQGAALLIMGMNVVFIIAIASAMARGLDISCGCFALADESSRVGLFKILEDIVFFAAAFFIYCHALGKADK